MEEIGIGRYFKWNTNGFSNYRHTTPQGSTIVYLMHLSSNIDTQLSSILVLSSNTQIKMEVDGKSGHDGNAKLLDLFICESEVGILIAYMLNWA